MMVEGECYLKTRTETLKRCWGVLIGHDFYCYPDQHTQGCPLMMHCLVGTFL